MYVATTRFTQKSKIQMEGYNNNYTAISSEFVSETEKF